MLARFGKIQCWGVSGVALAAIVIGVAVASCGHATLKTKPLAVSFVFGVIARRLGKPARTWRWSIP
jgi:hypothetical protein